MAITQRNFTNHPGKPNIPDATDIPNDPTKQTPEEKRKERQKEVLQKKIDDLNKRLEKFKKSNLGVITSKIREVAYTLQSKLAKFDPNSDPDYLYSQISPIIGKLRLRGRIDKGEKDIMIFEDKKRGDDYLYQVKIRDEQVLNKQDIARLNREKAVESIKWDRDGYLLYLWGPYVLPVTEQEPEKTETPGTPEI